MLKYVVLIISILALMKACPKAEPTKSAFTHAEIEKINPFMIIDSYTLVDEPLYRDVIQESIKNLIERGVLVMTPFGAVINPQVAGYALPVIIQSGGGLVSLGKEAVLSLNSLRSEGIKIHCYVGESQSAAFHIMVTACDKVIAKKNATLMQHRTAYYGSGTTPSTFQSDIEMSKLESNELGVKYLEWHNLARGEKDHVFTKEEIDKYKLVDEWMD